MRGDFDASTGVRLKTLRREGGAIEVETTAASTIECVGAGGAVLRTSTGAQGRMALTETDGPHVRARIREASGAMA